MTFTTCSRVLVPTGQPNGQWVVWAQAGTQFAVDNDENGFDAPATIVPIPAGVPGITLRQWTTIDLTSVLSPLVANLGDVRAVGLTGLLISTGRTILSDMMWAFRSPGATTQTINETNPHYPAGRPVYVWQVVAPNGGNDGDRVPCSAIVPVVDGKFETWVNIEANFGSGNEPIGHDEHITTVGAFGANVWLAAVYAS